MPSTATRDCPRAVGLSRRQLLRFTGALLAMPWPLSLRAGDRVRFDNRYLTDTVVMSPT